MKEAALQKQVLDYLKLLPRSWAVKYHGSPMSEVGVPDILACIDGHFLAIELKGTGGNVSMSQEVQIARIKKAGGAALVAYSLDQIKLAVQLLADMP